jgi:hypothetical protein
LQPAPIKMNPTNASSAGQALRVGKEIITKPQEGRPYERPRRISEILAEIRAWLPYPNGPSGAVFATRKQTRPEPPPELDLGRSRRFGELASFVVSLRRWIAASPSIPDLQRLTD